MMRTQITLSELITRIALSASAREQVRRQKANRKQERRAVLARLRQA